MMGDWKKTKLNEVCLFQEGYVNPSQKVNSYFGEDIKWLRANDLNNGRVYETSRKLSQEGFESAGKAAKLFAPGTLAISKSGTIGRIGLLQDYMCGNRAVINIVPDSSVSAGYIFYVLLKNAEVFQDMAVGSVQPNLYVSSLGQLEFRLPLLSEQKVIAGVLSSLDDKIDLLHRQNKTLEAMAETLFRQWFIVEAKEDWKECKVSDFADHSKAGVNPALNPDILYHHYSLPAFDSGKSPTIEFGREILSNKYEVQENSILVSKLNPRFPRIWPIRSLDGEKAICSTEFQVFKPKTEKLYGYLYFLLGSDDAIAELEMAASGTSSSHQRVRPEDILNIKTYLPSLRKAEEFSLEVVPFIEKILNNQIQAKTLEKLRDTLLPKLMSGEVRVRVTN